MESLMQQYRCPKCYKQHASFQALCYHAEHDHGMWYLAKGLLPGVAASQHHLPHYSSRGTNSILNQTGNFNDLLTSSGASDLRTDMITKPKTVSWFQPEHPTGIGIEQTLMERLQAKEKTLQEVEYAVREQIQSRAVLEDKVGQLQSGFVSLRNNLETLAYFTNALYRRGEDSQDVSKAFAETARRDRARQELEHYIDRLMDRTLSAEAKLRLLGQEVDMKEPYDPAEFEVSKVLAVGDPLAMQDISSHISEHSPQKSTWSRKLGSGVSHRDSGRGDSITSSSIPCLRPEPRHGNMPRPDNLPSSSPDVVVLSSVPTSSRPSRHGTANSLEKLVLHDPSAIPRRKPLRRRKTGGTVDASNRKPLYHVPSAKNKDNWRINEVPEEEGGAVHDAVQYVLPYLDTDSLLTCRHVCRKWRKWVQRPEYWLDITLCNRVVSCELLQTIAQWCHHTETLTLQGLKLQRQQSKEMASPDKSNRGQLEPGLEALVRASQNTLMSLSIVACGNLFTERSLWLAGTFCRRLQRFAYLSESHPATPEALWSLGAGCRGIRKLVIAPLYPNVQPKRFSNRNMVMIAKCWPDLRVLCVGGSEVSQKGLSAIALHCQRLETLELDHMGELREATAVELCRDGLRVLQHLYCTHTPMSPGAVMTFCNSCPHLVTISIVISAEDYYVDVTDASNAAEYGEKIRHLRALLTRPRVAKILRITAQ